MSNHKVKFNAIKKDKDGFVKLLVKFGNWYVPVLGKLIDLDSINEDEVKRLNLSRWILKDIPEVAKVIGELVCNDDVLLFYSGDGAWKFYDNPFAGIDESGDDFDLRIDKLNNLIRSTNSEFYHPHDDLADLLRKEEKEDSDIKYIKSIPAMIDKAKKQHKKLPYSDIGVYIRNRIEELTLDSIDEFEGLGRFFYKIAKAMN